MPLIPSKLSYLPDFEGRDYLYSRLDFILRTPFILPIRILTVWPNADRNAPIECALQIKYITPDHLPQYIAISYYWGNANDLETVIVHGSDNGALQLTSFEVPVTQNLASALRQFRAMATADDEPLQLWTDAICITQRNFRERSITVQLMDSIFRLATSVWVWLGQSDDVVEKGLVELVRFSELYDTGACRLKSPAHEYGQMTITPSQVQVIEFKFVEQIAAVAALPYWTRGWTIQEVSGNKVYLNFGALVIGLESWGLLLDLMMRIDRDARWRPQSNAACFGEEINPYLGALLSFCQVERISLGECMDQYKAATLSVSHLMHCKTRDPRDQVFALKCYAPWFAKIRPDYQKSVEAVFSEATVALLQFGGTWSMAYWDYPSASPHLPSWVVDFTHHYPERHGGLRKTYSANVGRADASAGSIIRVQPLGPGILQSAGFVFDEVTETTSSGIWGVHDGLMWPNAKHMIYSLDVSGRVNGSRVRCFVTKTLGGYAHESVEIGDSIAILASSKLPHILRPVHADYAGQDAYRLMGGCIVLDIMDGEAVYLEAERLCREQKGKLSVRNMFEVSKLAPLSYGARERCSKAANELAFEQNLCLV